MKLNTNEIITKIQNGFTDIYHNASPFVNSGELWEFCMDMIKNPITMSNIIFANDMGIPPVKSLVTLYIRKKSPDKEFKFTGIQSQNMGALMGYVFKFVLGYQEQKERCTVNLLGVRTAARFLSGPIVELEKEV